MTGQHRAEAEPGKQRANAPRESTLQIVITWLSGLLLLAACGYLVWEGMQPTEQASFSAEIESVEEAAGHYYLRLAITNEGGESVQGLGVTVGLRRGSEPVERANATVDWLPEGSKRSLVLIFEQDPGSFDVVVGFEGYQIP